MNLSNTNLKNSWECGDSNPGLRREKQVCYPSANQPPGVPNLIQLTLPSSRRQSLTVLSPLQLTKASLSSTNVTLLTSDKCDDNVWHKVASLRLDVTLLLLDSSQETKNWSEPVWTGSLPMVQMATDRSFDPVAR